MQHLSSIEIKQKAEQPLSAMEIKQKAEHKGVVDIVKKIKGKFPGVLPVEEALKVTQQLFQKHGFTPKSCLLAASTCSDEINRVVDRFSDVWGECFNLGGLAGLPFTGKSGFNALSHHIPDNGQLLILFAPHIGVTKTGEVGMIMRRGMKESTTACGSCMAAYEAAISRSVITKDDPDELIGDRQQTIINKIVKSFLPRIEKEREDALVCVANMMYETIKKEILKIIPNDFKYSVGLIGGIHVNTDHGDNENTTSDFFVIKDLMLRKGSSVSVK
eukprot:jgi/Bigna1/138468/aug1.45_g13176